MFKAYVVNLALLVATIFIGSQILKAKWLQRAANRHLPLVYGVALGMIGTILMVYAIPVTKHTIVDLRYVMLILAALYGTPVTVLATTVVMAGARFSLYPISTASWLGIAAMFISAAGCVALAKVRGSEWGKAVWMFVWCMIVSSMGLVVIVHHGRILRTTFQFLWPTSFIGSILGVYLVRYLVHADRLHAQFARMATTDHLTDLGNVRQDAIWTKHWQPPNRSAPV